VTRSNQKLPQALAKSPILWGGILCCVFYGPFFLGVVESEFVDRYFASHPVEYVTAIMFFVGMAALAIKAIDVSGQYQGLAKPLLDPIPPGGQPVIDCEPLAGQLRRAAPGQQESYLVRRLRDALKHVRRSGSADTIDDELKHLADLDADRLHAGYGLVRIFIWAIPILGFLGTVIGIAQAMGNLAPQSLENSMPEVMAGLTVAFDTTKLALGLSIVLMFAQFLTDQAENSLLAQVDQRVEEELVGRFERLRNGPDGQLVAVRRMVETLIDSTEQLVRQQTELWQASIDAAHRRWATMAEAGAEQLRAVLAGALAESLEIHAREVVAQHELANEANRREWQQLQRSLVQNTDMIGTLEKAVLQKAEMLGRAVAATDQVARLETTLNHNLEALAGARNFEQTVMSLAAAIHLLNARLQDLPSYAPRAQLELDPARQTGQAA